MIKNYTDRNSLWCIFHIFQMVYPEKNIYLLNIYKQKNKKSFTVLRSANFILLDVINRQKVFGLAVMSVTLKWDVMNSSLIRKHRCYLLFRSRLVCMLKKPDVINIFFHIIIMRWTISFIFQLHPTNTTHSLFYSLLSANPPFHKYKHIEKYD